MKNKVQLAAIKENSMKVPKKIKNRIIMWCNNPTTGYIYPEEMMSLFWRDIFTPIIILALFTRTKKWKQLING
jgi:hypothetical protein